MLGMPPDYRERAQCLRCCHPEREPVSADTLNSSLRRPPRHSSSCTTHVSRREERPHSPHFDLLGPGSERGRLESGPHY